MVDGQVVLVDEGGNGFSRGGQAAAHVGLEAAKGLRCQHPLTVGWCDGFTGSGGRSVQGNHVPSVVIGTLADPIGQGLDEGLKVGEGGQGRLCGEAELPAMTQALSALMCAVPSGVGVNAKPSSGVRRFGPHRGDVSLATGKRPIVGDAQHPRAGGVHALFPVGRRVVG